MSTHIKALAESFGISDLHTPLRGIGLSEAEIDDTGRLLGLAWGGNARARQAVNEALTTSDLFVSAAGEVFDRALLADYDRMPVQWTKVSARTVVTDFRPKKYVDLLGGRGTLAKVPEHTNYPEATTSSAEITIKGEKYGEQYGYTFEARKNDRLNELQRIPSGFAAKARATEDAATLAALANPLTGAPNTALFNPANKNIYTGALNADNVQAAITALTTIQDVDGNLLYPGPLKVVVGPALRFVASRLFGAQQIRTTTGGVEVVEANPLAGQAWDVLDNLPGTAWYVIPVPSNPRPALFTVFMAGEESPDLRVKKDQGISIGGGDVPVEAGSFDDDTIYFRVRHITGGAAGDPKFTLASDGTGTTLTKAGW